MLCKVSTQTYTINGEAKYKVDTIENSKPLEKKNIGEIGSVTLFGKHSDGSIVDFGQTVIDTSYSSGALNTNSEQTYTTPSDGYIRCNWSSSQSNHYTGYAGLQLNGKDLVSCACGDAPYGNFSISAVFVKKGTKIRVYRGDDHGYGSISFSFQSGF